MCSHLTCKVANKCVNVRERVEVAEWNKRWFPRFPFCPVSRQCPWKKTLIEKKNIRMSNFVLLKWRHFKHKAKFEKNGLFSLGLKYVIFDIFFKRRCKESFEDLEFNSNWKFQTRAALFHKMAALKFFLLNYTKVPF